MKKILSLVLTLVLMGTSCIRGFAAYSPVYETATEETITRGVTKHTYQLLNEDGHFAKVHMLEVDLTDPALSLEILNDPRGLSYRSSTKNILSSYEGAIAGVNGDFFVALSGTADRASSIGTIIVDGELLATPSYEEGTATFGIDAGDGSFILDYFKPNIVLTAPSGATAQVAYVNKINPLKDISMYTEAFGEYAQSGSLFQMAVQDGVVVEISRETEGMKIPEGGYVLSVLTDWDTFLPDHFQVGSPVGLQTSLEFYDLSKIELAVGGGSILVFNGVVPNTFVHDIQQTATARTAVGIDQTGTKLYLVTVDNKTDLSRGLRLKTLGEFLVSKGVWKAMNLDGGGSSTMIAKDFATGELEVKNTPSDGSMRYVTNVLGIVSTAQPQGTAAHLSVEAAYTEAMPGAAIPLTVLAADEFYYPVDLSGTEVTYSLSGVEGVIENGIFTAATTGTASITATAGAVSASCEIEITTDAVELHFEPRVLSMQVSEIADLRFTAVMRSGDSFSVPLSALSFEQSVPGIVAIGETAVKAVEEGETLLTAKLENGAAAYALICVGGETEKEPPADRIWDDALDRTGAAPLENAQFRIHAMAGMKNNLTLFDGIFNRKMVSYVNEGTDLSVFAGAFIDQSVAAEGADNALFADASAFYTEEGNAVWTLATTAAGANNTQELADFVKNANALTAETNIFVFANNDPRTFQNSAHRTVMLDTLEQKAAEGKNVFVIYPGASTGQAELQNGVRYLTLSQTPADMNAANFLQMSQSLRYLCIEVAADGSPTYRYVEPFAKPIIEIL